MRINGTERLLETLLVRLPGLTVIVLLFAIIFFLTQQAMLLFSDYSIADFLFKGDWSPLQGSFGALQLIGGTLLVLLIALGTALPASFAISILISETMPRRLRYPLRVFLRILASIPSVVFGFVGLYIVGPWLSREFGILNGLNAFTAGILLGFMAMPTIASISEDALHSVPASIKEAGFSLGASPLQTMFRVAVPYAMPGIIASIMLAAGRIIGETMTVLMVAGGAMSSGLNIFEPVRTITFSIAAEMGETVRGDIHYHALFALGLILFLINIAINTAGGYLIQWLNRRVAR